MEAFHQDGKEEERQRTVLTGDLPSPASLTGPDGKAAMRQVGIFDADTRQAMNAYIGRENLEERWNDTDQIDPVILTFMRERLSSQ